MLSEEICMLEQMPMVLGQMNRQERRHSMINASVQTARRHWWTLLLRGILSILFGIIALAAPGIALLAFIYVFAAYAILDGITAIAVSFQQRGTLRTWWVLLLEGIVGVLFGILAFAWPGETALILLYLVALWALVTGIMEIGSAFVMPGSAGLRWGLGLAGVVSLLFGLVLIVHPGAGLLAVLWLVGIYAVVFGVLLIISAFRVRSLASALSQRMEELRS
jgi:uncharacterized membrane protein HdeD (DUF308 family)